MIKLEIGSDYQQNENLSKSIEVTVSSDISAYQVFLEFKNEKGKFSCRLLGIDSDHLTVKYALPKSVTQYDGRVTVQAVAVDSGGVVEKSDVKSFIVSGSINATQQLSESENDLLTDVVSQIAQLRASASAGDSFSDCVRYGTPQTLTETQKAQSRKNIGAGTSDFSGRYEDLIDKPDSIGGQVGQNGENGKSAYEIACENGFVGTESQWLESLKGENGAKGDTGEAGANGTDGQDGENGKSAYEIACENGFSGTQSQWLESLKGSDGADGMDGKSAFELAVNHGFYGTEEEWLESLKGGSGSSSNVSTLPGSTETLGSYSLPIADANTLGGIKVGNNLSIDDEGVLSATINYGGITVSVDASTLVFLSGATVSGTTLII